MAETTRGANLRIRNLSPEQNLWLAALTLGIRDFIEDSFIHKPNTIQAVAWIYSNDTNVGSFDWVCAMLGFDADRTRRGLIEYRNRYTHAYKSADSLEETIQEEFAITCNLKGGRNEDMHGL